MIKLVGNHFVLSQIDTLNCQGWNIKEADDTCIVCIVVGEKACLWKK